MQCWSSHYCWGWCCRLVPRQRPRAPQRVAPPPAEAGKVKIRWWHIWGGSESNIADNWQKLADEYVAAHPRM